ncbi:MAG: Spy/CpxP family protein refolding chaperone [Hyphomicrobiales bacterium]|nr:Spy/CpxP family protein refolding chaperone [Hyphomicrobiales bacterium]
MARHTPTPRTSAAAAQQRPQTSGRNIGGRGGAKLAQPGQPGPRSNQARQRGPGSAATVGAAAAGAAAAAQSAHVGPNAAQQQNATQPNQLSRTAPSAARAASNARAFSGGVLRNQAFANLSAARDPSARALAGSTFQGRFFDPQWRGHRAFPAVIGWVGPLFWPYAYDDFVDYTFYPYAYDTFWPYAYDDFYDGMFGVYAEGYGSTYAAVGPPESYGGRRSASAHDGRGTAGGRSVGADLCSGQTAGLTDWPIERIAQTVEPNDAQRAALDELKDATAKALDILKTACPTALPSTPTGRIEAMHQRLEAMLQAVRTVRPALEKFYQSLNDEQKARFSALGSEGNPDQQRAKRDLTQACGERTSGIASLPLERIERAVQPNEAQRAALKQLQDATSEAANLLGSDCRTDRALTPVGRLQAMEQRLDAMLRAVQAVEPALQKFYASLGDEQKERFNRLSPTQG